MRNEIKIEVLMFNIEAKLSLSISNNKNKGE